MTITTGRPDGHAIIRLRNKDAILDAASRLFRTCGFDAVSIRDIAADAGIAVGTFYNHFPDKTALLRAIVDQHLKRLTPKLHRVRNESRTFREWSENYFRYLLNDLFDSETTHYIFLNDPGAARTLHDLPGFVFAKNVLEEDIVTAMSKGLIPNCDVHLLTRMIVGISAEMIDAAAKGGRENLETIVTFAANFLSTGVSAFGNGDPSDSGGGTGHRSE